MQACTYQVRTLCEYIISSFNFCLIFRFYFLFLSFFFFDLHLQRSTSPKNVRKDGEDVQITPPLRPGSVLNNIVTCVECDEQVGAAVIYIIIVVYIISPFSTHFPFFSLNILISSSSPLLLSPLSTFLFRAIKHLN